MPNVFIASVYSFIPLNRLSKRYRNEFNNHFAFIKRPFDDRYSQAECHYLELTDKEQEFYYDYLIRSDRTNSSVSYTRRVLMRAYLLRYREEKNAKGQYYLVVGTGINKAFGDKGKETWKDEDLCTEQDIIYLKRAFYRDKEKGFYNPTLCSKIYFKKWLNDLICAVSMVQVNGTYEQSYIVNIIGVNIDYSQIREHNIATLSKCFKEAFYYHPVRNLHQVINNCDRWAYGLIFGNNNFERVPPQQVKKVLCTPFSNNCSEKTYAGWSTIVFIKTHEPYTHFKKDGDVAVNFAEEQNIYEICATMNVKKQLRKITTMLNCNDATIIRKALGNIVSCLMNRPFGVKELDGKMNYIYDAMGINTEFEAIRQMGEQCAEAINIKNTMKLNVLMIVLAVITLFVGVLGIIVNK